MSIPASEIVSVTPGVLSAGGNPLALNGLVLTTNSLLPNGAPASFSTAASVATYFGASSSEAEVASVYFNGFDNSTTKPGALLFSRYPLTAIAAFLRGGTNALTLMDIQAITTGSLVINVDGTPATITSVNLSGATSFSNAAALITAAFVGATAPTVTYDSTFNAFVLTSPTTGDSSTIAYPVSGTLAAPLSLTLASGAILSQGADATTPAAHMAQVIVDNQNWVSFTSIFEPDAANKQAFATWVDGAGKRFAYVPWDTDITATQIPASFTGLGKWLSTNNVSGTIPVYNSLELAAFTLGTIASIDFTEQNGRITLAFKSQSGMTATATDPTVAQNLLDNGYNFYGPYATANDSFTWLYDGQISGDYNFADSYINAVWLNNQMQLALMTLLSNTKSIPYNRQGYALISAAVQDVIAAAVNFGAIRAGVPLSASQAAQVNAAAGVQIDQTLQTRGWYFQVTPASAQTRGLRQSPPCTLWYMDGGSVQQLNIASINIQ